MKKSFLHTQWLMVAVVCLLPCVVTAQTRKTQVKEQTFTKWFPNVELSDDVTLKPIYTMMRMIMRCGMERQALNIPET